MSIDAPVQRLALAQALVAAILIFPPLASAEEYASMVENASGSFEVDITPSGDPDVQDDVALGSFALSKTFSGDMQGTSRGQMLTATTGTKGSAGYVAIERYSGSLKGKEGSFSLQHSGTMHAGNQQLSVSIVPQSGTGELAGIVGEMQIRIEGGQHFYELEYHMTTSPETP